MIEIVREGDAAPKIVDRATFQVELDALRAREKAHTREGDAIAAARRRLPMVEMDSATPLIGPHGTVTLLDAFEGRRQAHRLLLYVAHRPPCAGAMRGVHLGYIAGPELSYLHSRDVTYAMFCQGPTKRVPGTANSWAGRCRGTRRPGIARDTFGWTPGWQDAPGVLPATRIQSLRDLLDDVTRRRGDG